MFALNIDKETGRILSATISQYASADAVIVDELPEGDISDYLYVDGEYVYNPLPETEQSEKTETADDVLNALLGVTE